MLKKCYQHLESRLQNKPAPFVLRKKVSLIGFVLRKVRKGTEMLNASQKGVTARLTNPGTPATELNLSGCSWSNAHNQVSASERNNVLNQKTK
jgi:hypothetical protein